MEGPLSSPEDCGPPARNATYLGRRKRKRAISIANQQPNSDSDSSADYPVTTPMKENTASPTKKSGNKTPASRGPKKVDVNLPGPSPIKRVRRDSDETDETPSIRKTHTRATLSISSLKEVAQKVADSPASKKPDFGLKTIESTSESVFDENISTAVKKTRATSKASKAKSVVAEDEDFDDGASLADSTINNPKTRRNEKERIEYYTNQPECGKLEPHAAQCTRCNKTVNLGKKQTYAVRPWEIHRGRCDQKPGNSDQTTSTATAQESASIVTPPESPAPSLAKSTPTPGLALRLTEIERKEFLEADKQIKKIEEARALCAKCDQWITLSDITPFATSNWAKHKIRCSDAVPSNRVASAKRRLLLVNDSQVQKFTSRMVVCKNCGATVQLKGEGDFNLTSWDDHKGQCSTLFPISRPDSPNSIPFPARLSRAPASSASTSSTVVVEPTAINISHGTKRSRDDHDIPTEDARAAVRPRTASYLPPQTEPPNTLMGWFMLPFQSFVRGFKESLKDRP